METGGTLLGETFSFAICLLHAGLCFTLSCFISVFVVGHRNCEICLCTVTWMGQRRLCFVFRFSFVFVCFVVAFLLLSVLSSCRLLSFVSFFSFFSLLFLLDRQVPGWVIGICLLLLLLFFSVLPFCRLPFSVSFFLLSFVFSLSPHNFLVLCLATTVFTSLKCHSVYFSVYEYLLSWTFILDGDGLRMAIIIMVSLEFK